MNAIPLEQIRLEDSDYESLLANSSPEDESTEGFYQATAEVPRASRRFERSPSEIADRIF